jgi:CRISPR/Cas system endoribonuclease Cas6 (RAMP superfamily)
MQISRLCCNSSGVFPNITMSLAKSNKIISKASMSSSLFSSPEHAQGELLGSMIVRRPSSVRRPFTFSCLHSSGRIFASIIIKLGQDAYLVDSSDEFEHGSSRMRN